MDEGLCPKNCCMDIQIACCAIQDVLRLMASAIVNKARGRYICLCNAHTIVSAQRDKTLKDIFNHAYLVLPDGRSLVWLDRLLGARTMQHIRGSDLLLAFSAMAEEKGYRNFYYGGEQGVPEQMRDNLLKKFPHLKLVGTFSPPFRELTPEEDCEVVEMINAASPDVLWVGLGAPKQERWMAAHQDRLQVPLMVGVGAAFNFHAGRVKEAPKSIQRLGMEWLFRIYQEPGRLWKRYLIYNFLFLYYFFLYLVGIKQYKSTP